MASPESTVARIGAAIALYQTEGRIEFADGYRMITSGNAIRKVRP